MSAYKLILFGAGKNGELALEKIGKANVAFFCDNNKSIVGKKVKGINVVSFEKMVKLHDSEGYIIMVTPSWNGFMIGQLEEAGINDYLIFKEAQNYKIEYTNDTQSFWDDKINYYTLKSKDEDWLQNIEPLKSMVCEIIEISRATNSVPKHSFSNAESLFYGNLQTLCRFAGVSTGQNRHFPIICHANPSPVYTAELYKSAVIVSGDYYKKRINKRTPYVPVFTIGPYIHYASGFYSNEKVHEEKHKIGKMLLVMLPHSQEFISRSYEKKKYIDEVIEKYKGFDSIWLCVYWIDINDPVCNYAQARGMRIVSAGFRFDDLFNNRLRTIIELCDAMVCGDLGTFISYALYLNKPIGRINICENKRIEEYELVKDIERQIQFSNDYWNYINTFKEVFGTELNMNKEKKEWANIMGGYNNIRTSQYLKSVFDITEELFIESQGREDMYPQAVRAVYETYYKKRDFWKMTILKDAVGNYLD